MHADFHFSSSFWPGHKLATVRSILITTASPMFARPISTPTLSFASPPLEVGADNATARVTAGAENQTVLLPPADAPPQVDRVSAEKRRSCLIKWRNFVLSKDGWRSSVWVSACVMTALGRQCLFSTGFRCGRSR
jgi:hypothetical protein